MSTDTHERAERLPHGVVKLPADMVLWPDYLEKAKSTMHLLNSGMRQNRVERAYSAAVPAVPYQPAIMEIAAANNGGNRVAGRLEIPARPAIPAIPH